MSTKLIDIDSILEVVGQTITDGMQPVIARIQEYKNIKNICLIKIMIQPLNL